MYMSRYMTKPTKWPVSPAKAQISLGIRPVWSESSLCVQWVAKDPSFLHADSKDWSDWVDAQADLSLHWVHMPFCWFCHEAAHFVLHGEAQSRKMFRPLHVILLVFMQTAKTDQTGWMHRLIWVFAGRTCHFVGFVMRRLISYFMVRPKAERCFDRCTSLCWFWRAAANIRIILHKRAWVGSPLTVAYHACSCCCCLQKLLPLTRMQQYYSFFFSSTCIWICTW